MKGLTMLNLGDKPNTTVVLIDGANLFATIKNLNFDLDFRLLRKELEESCNLFRIYYYTALVTTDGEKVLLKPLVDWLTYNGFTLITKPAKVITNRDGTQKIKGNMDVEITVDALDMASLPGITDIVLFTGDGDFCYMVENVQRKGVRVTVVSSTKTYTPMVADDLRKQCDTFIELDDWRESLAKTSEYDARSVDDNNQT